ncbi:MAG: ATP-binding protein, partial [Mycetocola sp.]
AGADPHTIDALYDGVPVTLEIGSYLASDGIPARLLAHRFNRHTFWCGQSGSGKTYALGVVLEQLLLHTALPMVIFDPNADFVRLREPRREGESTDALRMLSERDIRVLRPSAADGNSIRVRFVDLPIEAKAAVLRLHPLDDRAEYGELIHLQETVRTLDPTKIVPRLLERDSPSARDLAARVENLGVLDWSLWSGETEAVTHILDSRPDATVLDLGGFAYPDESLVVAMAVLDDLWAKREQRRPLLIVIDEAHNLCSPDQHSPLHVAVRERIIQIAAEGRKFGLWLLLSTQRPSRVHPSIISQCDNLALMRMTSPVDLDELGTIFGFVPQTMLARASRFAQGEALFAGGFTPAPMVVRMGSRLTREGGSDVNVPTRVL